MENLNYIKFKEFYDTDIKKYCEETKNMNYELSEIKTFKNIIVLFIAFLGISASIILTILSEEINLTSIVGINILVLIIFVKMGRIIVENKENKLKIRWNTIFNNELVPKLIKFIDEDLKYVSTGISLDKLYNSRLFTKEVEMFNSKNFIYGCFKGLNVELAYIQTIIKKNQVKMSGKIYFICSIAGMSILGLGLIGVPTIIGAIIVLFIFAYILKKTLSGRKNYDNDGDIFSGLFFSVDFNKEFNSVTIVKPDNLEKKIGEYGRVIQDVYIKSGFELARLENKEFEDDFIIITNNQQETRYILTPVIMEKLVKLSNERNLRGISFANGKINMAIENYKFREVVLEREELYNYCNDINKIFEIIDILDLNTRIWSKE